MASTVWRGRLAFGLVSIPVRLHKAARRDRIRFHHVYRPAELPDPESHISSYESAPEAPPPIEFQPQAAPREGLRKDPVRIDEPGTFAAPETVARVRQAPLGELGERPIPRSNILKGYEAEPGRYAVLKPTELAALRPRTSTELEISLFVRPAEIDPILFDASYYVAADEGGEKPYALLYRALAETGRLAVGSFSMHGREHAVAIRPGTRGLVLHTLFHANEAHREEEYAADPALVSGRELELAKTLVTALSGPFDASELKDSYEERLRELIQSRVQERVATAPRAPAGSVAPVVDIMDALRKSLEKARKPVRSESTAKPAPKGQKRRAK